MIKNSPTLIFISKTIPLKRVSLLGGVDQEVAREHWGVEDEGQGASDPAGRYQGQVPRPREGAQGEQFWINNCLRYLDI